MKPLKKRIQISLSGKKRKMNASQSNSVRRQNKSNYPSEYNSEKLSPTNSANTDSIINKNINLSLAIVDTVIRIYYLDLNDSILNKNKAIIKSYITRMGVHKITEISLSDFYSFEDPDKHKSESVKTVIGKYLVDTGVSKYRLFWRKNKRLKTPESQHGFKNLVYLEIRFN